VGDQYRTGVSRGKREIELMAVFIQREHTSVQTQGAKVPLSAFVFLVLTMAISFLWSFYKLLWTDELFVLHTDGVSSLAQLVHIQRTCPVAIDPLAYHVLAHFAIRLFGAGAFAIRLPALLGFLLMQVCLFFFVRRIAGERTAVFALAFPALTATLYYSAEGRPYGLMLGFFALAMLSWQTATRRQANRALALITLALAVALALNTHYYCILILVPLCAAEIFRSFQRGRPDLPVIVSIGAGIAGIVFTLPFIKAVGEFRSHNYDTGLTSPHIIPEAFRSILVDYSGNNSGILHALDIGIALFIVLAVWGCIDRLRVRPSCHTGAEIVFLVLLSALPIFGYLLSRFVTHSIEPRHLIPALVGLAPLLAIALSPLFRRERAGIFTLVALFVAVAFAGAIRIHSERAAMQNTMTALALAPEAKAALMASPSQLLYVQDEHRFATASYYESDVEVRSRLALVYSFDREMLWDQHNSDSLCATHLRAFTRLTIVPYELLTTQPGDHLFVQFKEEGLDWTSQAFSADHVKVTPLGSGLGGEIVSARFIP
jgi:uncharacterized membrane protein